jgi:hypothetical protein
VAIVFSHDRVGVIERQPSNFRERLEANIEALGRYGAVDAQTVMKLCLRLVVER